MSRTPLEISHINKSYGKQQVLFDINFSLKEGEIFGLVGLNGAGKTTMIKIILDLAYADSGEAKIWGVSSTHPKAREQLAYLPEKFQPSRYLKGKEYIQLSMAYYGKKMQLEDARARVATLDLDPDKLDYRVGAYSKGMGQKLGLVGTFLVDVPLLILDEPMSGLDPSARIKLKDQLLHIKNQGKTIFFSSHILSDIDEICDRIGVIHDGHMIYVGTPSDFKAKHKNDLLERAFLQAIAA